jgi:hypothetical protein
MLKNGRAYSGEDIKLPQVTPGSDKLDSFIVASRVVYSIEMRKLNYNLKPTKFWEKFQQLNFISVGRF